MAVANLERWRTQQIANAVERGIHPLDAANALDELIATLPPGADPATYVRPARELEQPLATEAIVQDARAFWYSAVDARMARILDAKQAE